MPNRKHPRPTTGESKPCQWCGTLIFRGPRGKQSTTYYHWPKQKYCSHPCTLAALDAKWDRTAVRRFWEKVLKLPGDGCWEWMAAKTGLDSSNSYGTMRWCKDGKKANHPAHRIAWFLRWREWPDEGLVVRHKCDNPGCVRFDHLELGTHQDNIHDQFRRNRRPHQVLTPDRVRELREFYELGFSQREIAESFELNIYTVNAVLKRRSWGWVA